MKKTVFPLAVVVFILSACDAQNPAVTDSRDARYQRIIPESFTPEAHPIDDEALGKKGGDLEGFFADMIASTNANLSAAGASVRLHQVEAIGGPGHENAGLTVFAKDVGNKRLSSHFVPGDERREWSFGPNDDITYAVDHTGDAVPVFGGLTAADTDAAIDAAMATWDAQTCSELQMAQNPDDGLDIGVIAFDLSGGAIGSPLVFADIQHAGWRDLNFPTGVLAVTFSFVFIETTTGDRTDIDGNRRDDTAFREIYYDPSYSWSNSGVNDGVNVDVETIALHEAGHGLSQGHFGTIAFNPQGQFIVSPLAVMNAGYTQVQRSLAGTDEGGHCTGWGSWPQN